MSDDADLVFCPILRKLVTLLERQPDAAADVVSFLLRDSLFEIEIAALALNATPETRMLIDIARDAVLLSDPTAKPDQVKRLAA